MLSVRYLVASLLVFGCGRISFEPLAPVAEEIAVEHEYPASGARWNDYVVADGSVCPYTDDYDDQFYDSCIHGAERLIARLPDETSCTDLDVSDELGAFIWKCREAPEVTLYTRGLRKDVRLATLLEADRWKPNRISVKRKDVLLYASQPEEWWSNPVVPLPDNSDTNVTSLDQASTIYTLAQSDWTVGYQITADGVGVVTLGDSVLSFSGTVDNCGLGAAIDTKCIISTALAVERLWLEGTFSGGAPARADIGLFLEEAFFSVVRFVRTYQFTTAGVYLYLNSGGLVDELISTDNDGRGFHDLYSFYAIERDIVVANNGASGMRVYDGGPWRLTNIVAVNNSVDGIEFQFNALGVLANVIVANNTFNGLRWITVDQSQTVTHRIVSLNNGSDGVVIGSMYDNSLSHVVSLNNATGVNTNQMGDGNRLAEIVAGHNGTYGLRSAAFSNTTYSDRLVFGGNAIQDCLETGAATNPGIDSSCQTAATVLAGRDFTGSFIGPTSRTAQGQLVRDWFEEPFTIWGRDGAPMAAGIRGPCGPAETCRAWDFSLATSDNVLRGGASTEPFVPNATCPAAVHGDRVMEDSSGNCAFPNWTGSCGRTFLLDAIELDDDYVGNDDGVCESNESCVYAPNFGLDQGSGNLVGPCTFVDGKVSGVVMFAREP